MSMELESKSPGINYHPDPSNKRVWIAKSAWHDIMTCVDLCNVEIGGMGLVEEFEEGLCVTRIFLLDQVVGSTHTDIDDLAIARLIMQLDAENIDTGKLRFWWHSHANFGAQPSAQDIKQIRSLVNPPNVDYYIMLIVNKSCDTYCRLEVNKPVRAHINPQLRVGHPRFGTVDWVEEFRKKITFAPPKKIDGVFLSPKHGSIVSLGPNAHPFGPSKSIGPLIGAPKSIDDMALSASAPDPDDEVDMPTCEICGCMLTIKEYRFNCCSTCAHIDKDAEAVEKALSSDGDEEDVFLETEGDGETNVDEGDEDIDWEVPDAT